MEYPITEQVYILNTKLSASELNDEIDKCIAKSVALTQIAANIDFTQYSSRIFHYYMEMISDLADETEDLRSELRRHEGEGYKLLEVYTKC